MEYHNDRFEDFSLLIFKAEKLVSVLPANRVENTVYSHQGLTYGGLVYDKKAKFKEISEIFSAVLFFLSSEGIKNLQIKLLPKIYHKLPSDELDYLFFLTEAKLLRTELSSTIDQQNKSKIQSNRLEGVKKAQKNELEIKEEKDFSVFWNEILVPNLKLRHNLKPVHTLEEIALLAFRFPKNIIQFNVYKDTKIVAGTTIFETENVAHVQYISANEEKQQLGSLDFIFHYLITERFAEKRYFDFGISNENHGKNINEGLLYWKECFGARSIVHQMYEVETKNYNRLDSVFI